jgi:DNA helicase-2/ATP-dependent DNA helicase PcrA
MKQEVPSAQRNQLSMQTFHSFFWTLLSAHAYLLALLEATNLAASG